MTAEPELVLFPDDATPYTPVGSITIPAPELLRALVAVVHAAGTDDARPILTSVAIQPRETSDAVRFVATDNYRIAICEVDADDLTDAGDWIGHVPAALEDVKRLIVVLKSIPDVKVPSCTARAVLTLGRREGSGIDGPRRLDAFVDDDTPIARLPLRVLDGLYPDYGLLIPRDAEPIGAFSGKYLAEAARFAGEFGSDTGGVVTQSRSPDGARGPFVFRNGRFSEIVMPVRTDLSAEPVRGEITGITITDLRNGRSVTIGDVPGRQVDPDTGEILPAYSSLVAEGETLDQALVRLEERDDYQEVIGSDTGQALLQAIQDEGGAFVPFLTPVQLAEADRG